MKYAWVSEHRDIFSVKQMCRALRMSPSGYYKSLKNVVSKRALRSQRICDDVAKVYEQSHQVYGSIKIAKQLQEDSSMESACRNTVAKAMQRLGLKSRVSRHALRGHSILRVKYEFHGVKRT